MIIRIIFRFGEHYYHEPIGISWQDFLITLIGSFIGILGALLIYRMKIRRDERNKDKEKENDFINRLKYFNLLIESITKHAEKQIENYLALTKKIKNEPYNYHLVDLNISNDITRISQMDSEEIFHAYLHLFGKDDETIKKYKKIYSSIDFIDERLKQQNYSQEKHIGFISSDLTRIKDLINGLADDIARILFQIRRRIDNEEDYLNEPVVKVLNESILKYIELTERKAQPYNYEVEFSKPLREKLGYQFKEFDFTDYLIDKSRKAAVLLEHVKYNSTEYLKDVEKIKDDLSGSIKELIETNNTIKKLFENS